MNSGVEKDREPVNNIAGFLDDHINRHGEVPSLIFEEKEYSNIWIREQSNRLANGLQNLGVKKGDRVALSLENCPQVLVIYQAVLRIGAVIAPIMFNLGTEETRFILDNCGASVFMADKGAVDKIQKATELPHITHIVVLGGNESAGIIPYERLIQDHIPEIETVTIDTDDIALQIYTAGTTGRPKGVMLSHGNLYHHAVATYELWDLEPRKSVVCLPFAHMFGVTSMLTDQLNRHPESVMVLMRWFDPKELFRLIEKYRLNKMSGVPTMFTVLLNDAASEEYDLSSLELCSVGSAPVSDELQRRFEKKFKVDLVEAYGLSESCSAVACTPAGKERKPGSAGTAVGKAELKIFDDNDNEVPTKEVGEVVVRGPIVMKGYYKRPEETRETLRGGWLHTGDVGYIDEDGYLFITDRKKDMIIKGGENIFPSEVENVLFMHPQVAETSVLGIPDAKYGEDVMAFVVKKPGADVTEDEIIAHCHQHYTKFKCPSQISFIDKMPKSGVGKILKRELRAMA